MSTGQVYDVIVIGGGPSGMMAAGRAAERGLRVLLLEKNRELGKKLSITGGGRCNILNAEPDTRKLLENYGDKSKYLHSLFAQHGMQDSWDFFESRGVPIVVEARKRAFPESQEASDVTKAMKQYVGQMGVEVQTNVRVGGFATDPHTGAITAIKTSDGPYTAHAYILATGGSARSETGSNGEGVNWLSEVGHTVHTPNPNIVPLTVTEDWVKNISGNTLSFMKITFGVDRPKKERIIKTGKILFTHFGLSGPLILNSAHEVKKLLKNGPVSATIDLYPDTDLGTIRNRILEHFNINKNKALKNVIKELVPAGMHEAVVSLLPFAIQEMKVHSVSREHRHLLADIIKAMPLTVDGTMGMDWAVISDGGVDLDEIDTKTMRSKKHDNLFLIGDTLHINRPSGGFSLQLCWTTGWVAGEHAGNDEGKK